MDTYKVGAKVEEPKTCEFLGRWRGPRLHFVVVRTTTVAAASTEGSSPGPACR